MVKKEKKIDILSIIIYGLIFFGVFFFLIHIANAYDKSILINSNNKTDIYSFLKVLADGLDHIEKYPFEITFSKSVGKTFCMYTLCVVFVVYYILSTKRKTLWGKEQGSARWATQNEEKKYSEKNFFKNMILTQSVLMSMNTRKTRKNNNILAIGGSGSGKTRFFVKPNIMQANTSFVITDPKGELLNSTAKLLEEEGYEIKIFNLVEMLHSCCYNPFKYIHKENDVFKLVQTLIKNTNPKGQQSGGDPFWEKSETALLQAIFFYLWKETPEEEQNFAMVMELLRSARASEENEDFESDLDIIFKLLEENIAIKNKEIEIENINRRENHELELAYIPEHIAIKQYKIFKMAGGKTAKSILISVGVRLSVFNLEEVANITRTDTLDLQSIGDKKTALYVVIPDSDTSFNFLVAMMYSQLFDTLYYQADFGETKWNRQQVPYRSVDSLLSKLDKIDKCNKDLEKTDGNKKKRELKNEIILIENDIKHEFGVYKNSKITEDEYKNNLINLKCDLVDRYETLKYIYSELLECEKKINIKELGNKKNEVLLRKRQLEDKINRLYGVDYKIIKKHLKSKEKSEKVYKSLIRQILEELKDENYEYASEKSYVNKDKKLKFLNEQIDEIIKVKEEYSLYQFKKIFEINNKIKELKFKKFLLIQLMIFEFGKENIQIKNNGRLNYHVRCLLDEFANIGEIPDFTKLIATMRSREISVSIIIQNLAQLKEMYKDSWESITGNCDSLLFLGGQEQTTLEYISKKLGKTTLDKRSTSRSRGKQGSSSQSWDVLGRELMTADEISTMKDEDCILFIRGTSPYFSKKYNIEKHKRYGLLSDSNVNNIYKFREKFNTKKVLLSLLEKEKTKLEIDNMKKNVHGEQKEDALNIISDIEKQKIKVDYNKNLKEEMKKAKFIDVETDDELEGYKVANDTNEQIQEFIEEIKADYNKNLKEEMEKAKFIDVETDDELEGYKVAAEFSNLLDDASEYEDGDFMDMLATGIDNYIEDIENL